MIIGIVIDTEAKTADFYDNSHDDGEHITLHTPDLYELCVKQIPRGIAEIYKGRKADKDGK